ncbi:hypothetical protein C7E17_24770, partial [Stenotrophomonas maltophilia]
MMLHGLAGVQRATKVDTAPATALPIDMGSNQRDCPWTLHTPDYCSYGLPTVATAPEPPADR